MPPEFSSSFARIKALVIGRTLHHYYQDKDALLRERVQRRMDETGLGEAGYLRLLSGGDGAEAEWTALEAEITIGETFFFRYAEQFAALSDTILPALLRARAATRTLSIWSAGCASGAEPYSVAILLHRLLGPALRDWTISILGTDISSAALQAAQAAEYGEWALRALPDAERRRDFRPVPGSGGRRWTLLPAYRAMVRFERRNLLGLLDGTVPARHGSYDLVLCRNVLIYFQADRVQALVRRFGESLAPDGWLLLGHAEAATVGATGLQPVPLRDTVAWRREEQPSSPPAWVPPAPLPAQVASRPRSDRPGEAPTAAGSADGAVSPEADAVDRVRTMADAGKPDAALRLCRQELDRHPASAPLLFYAGLLQRVLGHEEAAEGDFRRAISVGQDFAMAHYHLGLLLLETGQDGPGRRAVAEAGRIARALPDDHVLDCGDGITAQRLRALARFDWLPAAALP